MAAPRILIVEDEPMIAMMVENFLEELGWSVVGLAGGLEQAAALARDAEIDAAVLDVNLHGHDTFAVADILRDRRVAFVFATGYGANGLADRFKDVPTVTKPFRRDELKHALILAISAAGVSAGGPMPDPAADASPDKPTSPGYR